jgi:hypothetical protein
MSGSAVLVGLETSGNNNVRITDDGISLRDGVTDIITIEAGAVVVSGSILEKTRLFGNGADGAVATNDATLTRDMYYKDLTVNANKTLETDGFRIFVKDTLTMNNGSVIQNSGATGTVGTVGGNSGAGDGGSGGAAGGGAAGGSLQAGTAGSRGGAGGGASSGSPARGGGGGGGGGGTGGIVFIYARLLVESGTGTIKAIGGVGGQGGSGEGG